MVNIIDKNIAAVSLSELKFFGHKSLEGAVSAFAEVPLGLNKIISNNLDTIGLKERSDVVNDYVLSDGILSLSASGIQKLSAAGVESPLFNAIQGKTSNIARR